MSRHGLPRRRFIGLSTLAARGLVLGSRRAAGPAPGRGDRRYARPARTRVMTSWAALWPGAPMTQPPGHAPDPQR
jgi:hypothetical protein